MSVDDETLDRAWAATTLLKASLKACCDAGAGEGEEDELRCGGGGGAGAAAERKPASLSDPCPYCHAPSPAVALVDGLFTCRACQTVVSRFLDCAPEWRLFSSDPTSFASSKPTRCGQLTSALLPSMGSVLVPCSSGAGPRRFREAAPGRPGEPAPARRVWSGTSHRDRSLFSMFDRLCLEGSSAALSPSSIDASKSLYKRALDGGIARGYARQALMAACVFVSCKTDGAPRSVREVADLFGVNTTTLTRVTKELQHRIVLPSGASVKDSEPGDFVGRFCSKLALEGDFVRACRGVLQVADDLDLCSDSTPPTMTAGAIMLVASARGMASLDTARVAAACFVSPITVLKSLRKLSKHRAVLLGEAGENIGGASNQVDQVATR